MDQYNQVKTITTQDCILSGANYCQTWAIETTTTYNFFDLLVLLCVPLMLVWLYRLFTKRRR